MMEIDCNLARVIADGQPSLTAQTAAAARAAHLIVDDEPRIFADTLARGHAGRAGRGIHRLPPGPRDAPSAGRRAGAGHSPQPLHRGPPGPGSSSTGSAQYVLLGAGLDSFAYRSRWPAGCGCSRSTTRPRKSGSAGSRPGASRGRPGASGGRPGASRAAGETYVPVDFTARLTGRGPEPGGVRRGPARLRELARGHHVPRRPRDRGDRVGARAGSRRAPRSSWTTCCPPGCGTPRGRCTRTWSGRPPPSEASRGDRCSRPRL